MLGIGVGAGITFSVRGSGKGGDGSNVKNLNKKARDKKEERKVKILETLENAPSGRIRNDDVESMLGVSDATVTNYFDELEKEGKIIQVGKQGQGVYYELK